MNSFTVELRSGPVVDLDADTLERFSDELFEDSRLIGPAPSADLALHVLELRTNVEANNVVEAIERASQAFLRAAVRAKIRMFEGIVDASGWDGEGESGHDRRQLLSGADIAERLGISRQRIAQLVAEKGRFPRPAATFGTISVWHWGDVADWIAAGGRGPVNRLDADAVLQVYELAHDELLRIAAILRMVDLANEGDATAESFCEILGKSVVYHDDETRTWSAGALLRKYEQATSEREKSSTVVDLMEALKRRVERAHDAKSRSSKKTA